MAQSEPNPLNLGHKRYSDLRASLVGVARKHSALRAAGLVEDVVGDAIATVLKLVIDGAAVDSLEAFAHGVLRNKIRERLRALKRRAEREMLLPPIGGCDSLPSCDSFPDRREPEPEKRVHVAEIRAAIEAALSACPLKYRQVVLDVLDSGKPRKEVASRHGMSTANVTKILTRYLPRMGKRIPPEFRTSPRIKKKPNRRPDPG